MTRLQVPFGSQVMIGAPANPPGPSTVSAITAFLSSVREVSEAHLVQCHFPGLPDNDGQAIVVVVESNDLVPTAVDRIVQWLNESLPQGMSLYVWPMRPSNGLLPLVREANCALVPAS